MRPACRQVAPAQDPLRPRTLPYERDGIGFAGQGSLYRSYLNAVLGLPAAWIAVDFYSAAAQHGSIIFRLSA